MFFPFCSWRGGCRKKCDLKGRLLRDQLAEETPRSCGWADELEKRHNLPMVWERTNGKPRVSQEGEEGPALESLGPEVEESGEGPMEEDARSSAGHKFGKTLTASEAELFLQTGLDLLKRASIEFSWKETSHCGFRPMNLAGYAKATQIWIDFNQHAVCWTKHSTHGSSLAFPSGGLCDKVLTDRIRNLAASRIGKHTERSGYQRLAPETTWRDSGIIFCFFARLPAGPQEIMCL